MTRRSWDHGGKTTTERGYGWQHQLMRAEIMRTVVLCEECWAQKPPIVRTGTVADHIIPLAKGGMGERSNYRLLCRECADEKDAKDRGATYKPKRRISLSGWPE
jgi:5-methylcytosine-specific restriction protein A